MKKRVITLLLAGTLTFTAVGCTKITEENSTTTTENSETVNQIEYVASDYVTLGDYKGIEITLTGDYEYTDEGFDSYVEDTIASLGLFVEDSSQTEVKEDSIVNVDYVGSQDGVAFDGGSAEDQTLDVANNCMAGGTTGFISGFTAGLVGSSVGDEVAYEVTFPDEYGSEELAGQTVIFTFNINYIAKEISSKDDLTDEIVSANLGYDTVDEYIENLKETYISNLESNLESDKETAVLNTLINNSTVSEIPEGLLQARLDLILNLQERQYAQYNTTMQEYVESMGYDYEEIVQNITDNVEESTKTELILQAIADAEDIQVDEDDYNSFITEIYTNLGYTDADTFYADYSVDGCDGKSYFELAYRTEKATDFCIENAVVNFEPASEDSENTEDAAE